MKLAVLTNLHALYDQIDFVFIFSELGNIVPELVGLMIDYAFLK